MLLEISLNAPKSAGLVFFLLQRFPPDDKFSFATKTKGMRKEFLFLAEKKTFLKKKRALGGALHSSL